MIAVHLAVLSLFRMNVIRDRSAELSKSPDSSRILKIPEAEAAATNRLKRRFFSIQCSAQ